MRGSGQMFCGGADIREFGSTNAFQEPLIHDVSFVIVRFNDGLPL